jgi:GTP-binding protein Era
MHASMEAIEQVDVLGVVVDASEKPGGGTRYLVGLLERAGGPVVLILNKIDRVAKPKLLPMIDWYSKQHDFAEIVPISAMTGDGVARLEQVILRLLPEGEALYPEDFLTDQPERVLAAEIVREKLLAHTREELPFSTAVVVDRFEDADAGGLMRLYCSILVEQESQKPIVLGRRGDMIKRIGTEARQELEAFFNARVFLDLHVKVRPRWREDEGLLDELGLK